MSDKRYEANIIRATAVEPANNLETTSAPAVWSIDEVVELQKKNKWPTVGNVTTDVTDVFSTFLWEGNSSTRNIQNGIDLTEGGLVWGKARTQTYKHTLFDTARGANKAISSNSTDAEVTETGVTAFNSNGFTLGTWAGLNDNGEDFVSWTFRKAPKFFDVVTYTNSSGSGMTINHNLGVAPAVVIVKKISGAANWTYSTNFGGTLIQMELNTTNASSASNGYVDSVTSTTFTTGSSGAVSSTGDYVAYLFAHNNSDGEFGPSGDQDIIKCGSISGYNGRAELGFEPQWVLLKATNYGSTNWIILDVMRGWEVGSNNDAHLFANLTNAEADYNGPSFDATGFNFGQSGDNYIYIAIRRGPLATPTSATNVFAVEANSSTGITTGFPVDWRLSKGRNGSAGYTASRLTGQTIYNATESNAAQFTSGANFYFDSNTGVVDDLNGGSDPYVRYAWKRAPGYFDVVAYTGTGVSGRTVSHSLGVVPEMMWVKRRSGVDNWTIYAGDATSFLRLNTTDQTFTSNLSWNDTAPTASVFSVGNHNLVNGSGETYIAYLFATVAGVSKVGSYTGDGNTGKQIDCGFSSGARFILIKASSGSGSWFVWDSVRGIVSGNDPYLQLNNTDAEVTGGDNVDPYSAGFIVNGPGNNASGVTYIFYAIA